MPLFDNSKKSLILFYKLLGVLILFLGARVCYLGIYGFSGDVVNLEATITSIEFAGEKFFSPNEASYKIKYEFYYDGKDFRGEGRKEVIGNTEVAIGDKIGIVFYPNAPKYSRLDQPPGKKKTISIGLGLCFLGLLIFVKAGSVVKI
jgi:hypothetical protein